jgi:hypothetical protein
MILECLHNETNSAVISIFSLAIDILNPRAEQTQHLFQGQPI